MRGQAHTLEATIAGLLMLASLIFALQMTAVTPLAASSGQHIQNQQQASGQGVLATADNADALKPAVLYWNSSSENFHNASSEGTYISGPPNTTFGRMLNQSFNQRGIAYNVNFRYQQDSGEMVTRPYIYSGEPSDGAAVSSHAVTITQDDPLYDADETRNSTLVSDADANYLVDNRGDGTDSKVYNTVQVEVVVWRV